MTIPEPERYEEGYPAMASFTTLQLWDRRLLARDILLKLMGIYGDSPVPAEIASEAVFLADALLAELAKKPTA